MNLTNVRGGISDVLADIPNLRVYDKLPNQLSPPAAAVALGDAIVDTDFDGATTVNWTVILFLSRVDDERAQAQLDMYLSSTGSQSVIAAFDADPTLGDNVDTARVVGWDIPSTFTVAGVEYVGVEVNVETIG